MKPATFLSSSTTRMRKIDLRSPEPANLFKHADGGDYSPSGFAVNRPLKRRAIRRIAMRRVPSSRRRAAGFRSCEEILVIPCSCVTAVPRLIGSLQLFSAADLSSVLYRSRGGGHESVGTHRPATNLPRQPHDGLPKTFERDDALWSDNEYSDVVQHQDSTIRVSQDQSQRARNKGETI